MANSATNSTSSCSNPAERFRSTWRGERRAALAPLTDATVGVLFADPGKSSAAALSAELLPGRTYAVRCIFRDHKDAPRHQALGMYSDIRITAAARATAPPPRVDTIVGTDYAFRAPATLAPGTH